MEYTGFISSLVERSESVLGVNARTLNQTSHRDTSVTRLLLLLNTGFGMVWERIDTVQNHDDPKFKNAYPQEFKKVAKKTKVSECLKIEDRDFFQKTSEDLSWNVYHVPEYKNPHNISDLIKGLCAQSRFAKTHKKNNYKELFMSLRNSFAHGGVHPLSPRQTCDYAFIEQQRLQNPKLINENNIYKIYFVSKWGESKDPKGHTIIEFSVPALMNFWYDWREIILSNKVINLSNYDNAA